MSYSAPKIRPEFLACASAVAIEIELGDSRRALGQWYMRVKRLEQLLAERRRQIEAGEWPPKPVLTEGAGARLSRSSDQYPPDGGSEAGR